MMPEGTESKPYASSGAAAGTFSFLGSFSRGIFGTNTSTVDQVDSPVQDLGDATAESSAGLRRAKTFSDFGKMSIPEDDSTLKDFSISVAPPKIMVEATTDKQGSDEGLGLSGMHLGNFTKTFANLNMDMQNNTNTGSESLKPPEAGALPRRGSMVWEWLNTSVPQQDMMKPEAGSLGRRHSNAVTEMAQQQQQLREQQQEQLGMGKKKLSYRDLNAYAPSNW